MKFLLSTLLLAVVAVGCATKAGTRREMQRVMVEERQRTEIERLQKEPAVWFRGDVQMKRVTWREGLTLAAALTEARYTGFGTPELLTVTRAEQVYTVNVRALLRGQDNPEMEPGDVVEVRAKLVQRRR
jgi:hypothetical protein